MPPRHNVVQAERSASGAPCPNDGALRSEKWVQWRQRAFIAPSAVTSDVLRTHLPLFPSRSSAGPRSSPTCDGGFVLWFGRRRKFPGSPIPRQSAVFRTIGTEGGRCKRRCARQPLLYHLFARRSTQPVGETKGNVGTAKRRKQVIKSNERKAKQGIILTRPRSKKLS